MGKRPAIDGQSLINWAAKPIPKVRHQPKLRVKSAVELNFNPYFVPRQGKDYFINLAKRLAVNILTNAMSATDVKSCILAIPKHKELLKAGVKLYELKPNAIKDNLRDSYLTGSSTTNLHAKTFESDGEKVYYIGSFNFDPRSALTNTARCHRPPYRASNKIRNEFLQPYQQSHLVAQRWQYSVVNARERSNRHVWWRATNQGLAAYASMDAIAPLKIL